MEYAEQCPRCKRPQNPWPLERGDRCSPKDWAVCIRPFTQEQEERLWARQFAELQKAVNG